MTRLASIRMSLAIAAAASVVAVTRPLQADVVELTKRVAGTTVHYKVVLPNGYDPGKAYPGILALAAARKR